VHVEHGRQQVLDDLILALLPRLLDLGYLCIRLLVGLVFGRLVPLCVL
jgi:hypothetical protein